MGWLGFKSSSRGEKFFALFSVQCNKLTRVRVKPNEAKSTEPSFARPRLTLGSRSCNPEDGD